ERRAGAAGGRAAAGPAGIRGRQRGLRAARAAIGRPWHTCRMTAARPLAFDLIAFDWDGTLFDSTTIITRCIQQAVRDVGGTVPSDKDAAYVIGMGLMQALAHAAPDVPQSKYPELGARYRHHYVQHQNDIVLFDGVLPLLAALKARGHKLAVATGKSRKGLDE